MKWKIVALLVMIVTFSQAQSSLNYMDYHKLIDLAESELLGDDYSGAFLHYEKAFNQFQPFDVDILNYIILKINSGAIENQEVDSLLQLYIVRSEADRKHYISVLRKQPKQLRARVKNVEIVEDQAHWASQTFMDSILKKDQRIRNPIIFALKGWEKASRIDSSNFDAIKRHFTKHGHLGVMRGPVDDMTIIYLHNPHRLLESNMILLIKQGKLHPCSFAYIYSRMGITDNTNDKYGRSALVISRTESEIQKINKNRIRIGLQSLQKSSVVKAAKLELGLLSQF